jgi:hypothetical protein
VDTGVGLVLTAGTLTFGNAWYQDNQLDWRVPVATLLAAGMVTGVEKASPFASTALGAMVLIGAVTFTPKNGVSCIQEAANILNGKSVKAKETGKKKR